MNKDFMSIIKDRYSVRTFTDQVIDNQMINKIIEVVQFAPTACNRQPLRIIIMNNEESILKLKKCTESHYNAKTAILVCYDKKECWERSYDGQISGEVDASIAATYIMLSASTLGIGTTWVMYFIPEAFKVEFSLPDEIEPVALLVMGYPAKNSKPALQHFESKLIKDMVSYNEI